eukprot:1154881-Pelagomonas_calceolata.AAC.8
MAHLSSSSEVPVVVGRVRRKGCLRRMLFLVSTGPSAQALDAGRRRKLLPAHTAPAHGQWIGGVRCADESPPGSQIALGNWKSLKSNNVFMKSMVPGSSSRRGAVLLGGSSSIQA